MSGWEGGGGGGGDLGFEAWCGSHIGGWIFFFFEERGRGRKGRAKGSPIPPPTQPDGGTTAHASPDARARGTRAPRSGPRGQPRRAPPTAPGRRSRSKARSSPSRRSRRHPRRRPADGYPHPGRPCSPSATLAYSTSAQIRPCTPHCVARAGAAGGVQRSTRAAADRGARRRRRARVEDRRSGVLDGHQHRGGAADDGARQHVGPRAACGGAWRRRVRAPGGAAPGRGASGSRRSARAACRRRWSRARRPRRGRPPPARAGPAPPWRGGRAASTMSACASCVAPMPMSRCRQPAKSPAPPEKCRAPPGPRRGRRRVRGERGRPGAPPARGGRAPGRRARARGSSAAPGHRRTP